MKGITKKAKENSEDFGRELKSRYEELFPPQYSSSIVEMTSIASLRHTLTAQAVLFGMFPDKITYNDPNSPVSFFTLPQIFSIHTNEPEFDYLLRPTQTCPL